MPGVEREEPCMPVPRAEQRDDPQSSTSSSLRESVGARRARSFAADSNFWRETARNRVRVIRLDRLDDEANVTRGIGGRGWSGVRPGCKHHHGE